MAPENVALFQSAVHELAAEMRLDLEDVPLDAFIVRSLHPHLLLSSQSGTSSSTVQRKVNTPVGPRPLKRLLNSARRSE